MKYQKYKDSKVQTSQVGVYIPQDKFAAFDKACNEAYGNRGKSKALNDILIDFLENPIHLEAKEHSLPRVFSFMVAPQVKEKIQAKAEDYNLSLSEVVQQLITNFVKRVDDGEYIKPDNSTLSDKSEDKSSDATPNWGEL